MIYVAAFALDEYTAAKEHGWESKLSRPWCNNTLIVYISLYRKREWPLWLVATAA